MTFCAYVEYNYLNIDTYIKNQSYLDFSTFTCIHFYSYV